MKINRRLQAATAAAICLLVAGCGGEPTPKVVAGVDGCASCGMVIDRVNQAAGWIDGGQFVTFCSPSCLLAEHDDIRMAGQTPPDALFFANNADGTFSPGVETAFLLTDHRPTVMNARVICFASVVEAEATRQHDDEMVTDWTGYRVQRGTPDTIIETIFGPEGMTPEIVVANKGDIVLWRAGSNDLEGDLAWTIKGYPEVDPPVVVAQGDAAELRFMATRPGAGFPIEELSSGEPLGMLKVGGAHTAEEAAR